MKNTDEIERKIFAAKKKLAELDARRSSLLAMIEQLQKERDVIDSTSTPVTQGQNLVSNQSSEAEKILLFRNLFQGREDVYPRRFKSRRTGKSGYQPACANEWKKGICEKPRIRCGECDNREFLPLTDEVIRYHLLGVDPKSRSKDDFTIGVYPLLVDEDAKTAETYGVSGLPTSFFIDGSGKIREKHIGWLDEQQILEIFKKIQDDS